MQSCELSTFDKFWDEALLASKEDGDYYELDVSELSTAGMSCEWLRFRGIGNQRISCFLLRPTDGSKAYPAICMFHGYKGYAAEVPACQSYADLIDYAKYYVICGFIVLIMFARGQALESRDDHRFSWCDLGHMYLKDMLSRDINDSYCRALFTDAAKCVRILKTLDGVDATSVSLLGYSQGGDIAIACGALEHGVKSIICGGASMIDCPSIMRESHDSPKSLIGSKLFLYFKNHDTSYQTEHLIGSKLMYNDLLLFAPKIKAKIMYVMNEEDPISISSLQLVLYNKLATEKNIIIFKSRGHLLPNDFYRGIPYLLKDNCFPLCKKPPI